MLSSVCAARPGRGSSSIGPAHAGTYALGDMSSNVSLLLSGPVPGEYNYPSDEADTPDESVDAERAVIGHLRQCRRLGPRTNGSLGSGIDEERSEMR